MPVRVCAPWTGLSVLGGRVVACQDRQRLRMGWDSQAEGSAVAAGSTDCTAGMGHNSPAMDRRPACRTSAAAAKVSECRSRVH